jgi:exonuclease V
MATITRQVTHPSSHYGSEVDFDSVASLSDYGSEFDATEIDEDALLADVLDSIVNKTSQDSEKQNTLPSIEFEERETEDRDCDVPARHRPAVLRVARGNIRNTGVAQTPHDIQSSPVRKRESTALEVEYYEPSRRTWSGKLKQPRRVPFQLTTDN